MKKNKINSLLRIAFLAIVIFSNMFSLQAKENKELLPKAISLSEEGYLKFDKSFYIKSHGICERILSSDPENIFAKYYLGYNKYRLVNIAMVNKDSKLFDLYYESTIKTLEPLMDNEKIRSDVRSLLAATYMMKLATDNSEAQTLSIKINSLLEQAKKMDPNNPRSYLIKGTMLFNTPKMFGGSIDGALKNFIKVISIFESEPESKNEITWGYLEALAWKGIALAKKGDVENARLSYEQALKIAPDFGWVKYNLLPKLDGLENKNEANIQNKSSNLKVVLTGFNSSDGFVLMKLMNSDEQYDGNEEALRSMKKEIINGEVECHFTELPYGEYAFKCYHDKNNNGKLDKNFLGMPKESYGFSNNATGSFGPPSYTDARFTVDKSEVTIEINLN